MRPQRYLFKDRSDAAQQLRELLPLDRMKSEAWNLIAVSSGGLVIASYLNTRLKLPIDFIFSAGITAPQNSECELARVSETEEIVIHQALVDAFDIQVDYIYGEANRKHEEKILSAIYQYRKGENFKSMKGKNILLIDEGSETGLKLMCAIKTAFAQKAKAVYVAAPIMPTTVVEALDPMVDGIFCLQELDDYIDTGYYYQTFDPVDEETIETILEKRDEIQHRTAVKE
ncbi:MAG: phosphoribosyltransferase [Sulfuricurvum sp.]|uniref:phosphoribosyltransferase n=1 Tax=Sulfuricurvum sp. TaxID=2025608 RepID=UPI0026385608|nr:phosphoribosyltransferase [Sulfuricurvum sp.]MDD2838833.1 phosphoribosyltransferase [Sulfuricurvum sp.]MDD3596814.1 phosphoribosyltransferase [Sulfuricurvum sp.]MDD4884485.1 phosphoribosyltransferase [Sulfuricurvum sp.]